MNITHLCLSGTITDGWSYQENLLSRYHKRLGHEVTIITSIYVYDKNYNAFSFEKEDYINSDGVRVIRLKLKKGYRFSDKIKRYKGVEAALENAKPEILFIHGCQFIDAYKVIRYLKKNNITVYVDNHADFSNSATNFLSKTFLHGIIWRHCAHLLEPYTTKFYGVLPARVDFLKNVYKLPEDKVELLVMGGDDDLAEKAENRRFETRKKYGVQENDFLIVTGGKIDKWKKQTLYLMEAVKRIKRNNIKILVFGSVAPELQGEIESYEDCKQVQYIGWIDSDYSYDLFAAADIVVFPGRHSVFWEQVVSQGIPMIVKDWEGTHHIDLGGNVIFLNNDSVDEIEEKLLSVIDSYKYENMLNCAKLQRKQFSYLSIAKRSIGDL